MSVITAASKLRNDSCTSFDRCILHTEQPCSFKQQINSTKKSLGICIMPSIVCNYELPLKQAARAERRSHNGGGAGRQLAAANGENTAFARTCVFFLPSPNPTRWLTYTSPSFTVADDPTRWIGPTYCPVTLAVSQPSELSTSRLGTPAITSLVAESSSSPSPLFSDPCTLTTRTVSVLGSTLKRSPPEVWTTRR
jgi:hypothetical protein